MGVLRAEVNGIAADPEVWRTAQWFGHFTFMQVRGPGSLLSLDTLGTLPLERLLLRQREPLQDLEFLRQLPDLRSLSLDALDEIADFSPIATSGALVIW